MESVARSSDIPGGRTSGPLSCCVSIVVDEKGKARFDHLSLEPPESGDWLNVDLRRFRGTRNSFRPPFERFYLNEKLAPEAERILMDAFANGEAELVVPRLSRLRLRRRSAGGRRTDPRTREKAAYFSRFDARMTVLR